MSDDTRDPQQSAPPRRQRGHAVFPGGKRPAPKPGTVRQKGHPVLPTPHTAG